MNNAELLRAVEGWARANYGLPADSVSIKLRGIPDAVVLPVFLGTSAPPADDDRDEQRGASAQLHPCTRDILATLRDAGRPLTKTRLFEEMEARRRAGQCGEYSERTIDRRLAELIEDGTIENPPDARPRGYRVAAGDA